MPDPNVIFFHGNDEFAMARRLNQLQQRHDREGLNTARLEARTASLEEINNALNAMPFLAEKRLVFLANPSARSSAPAVRAKFLDLLLAAPPTTLVVLHELVEPRDASKHWLLRQVGKGGLKAEAFMLPRAREMPGWIIQEARAQGGRMELEAAALLAEMTGPETRQAAQEITKLLTYVDYARPVTKADVEALCVVSAQGDVFALVDALSAGQGQAAQRMLHRLLETEDALALWGMVIRQFRLLLQGREIVDGGGTAQTIKNTLNVHEYVAGKIFQQAQRFTLPHLEAIYHHLLEMDEAAKTGGMPLDVSLDLLVVELTR